MNTIHQQPDTGLLPVELAVIDRICDEIAAPTSDRDNTDEQAWHRAAVATKSILRDHSKGVIQEWFSAHAGLPPMNTGRKLT